MVIVTPLLAVRRALREGFAELDPKVKAWLARHPRWTFHFAPRGRFHSIVSLQAAINQYLDQRNAEPRPFVWTASAASILAKLSRLPVASE
jgi:hypothetical protein